MNRLSGRVPAVRVMIVDDHPIYRDGLSALLAAHEDLELVAEAVNGQDAVALFREHQPDVTLMDLSMPVMGGADAIAAIVREFSAARIVALTTYDGDGDIRRALDAGARGYLLKDVLRSEVAQAIRTVYQQGWILPDAVARRLAAFEPRSDLSVREVEVLRFAAKGLKNHEIAELIGRSEATVKVHIQHILEKLGAADRTEAVWVALERGILHL